MFAEYHPELPHLLFLSFFGASLANAGRMCYDWRGLSELNALLNMDEREDTETEQAESKEKEERPARGSIHEKLQIYKEKSQRESETGKETRKRDFGLE